MTRLTLAAALLAATAMPAAAQDHSMHGAAPDLPAICLAQHDAAAMPMPSDHGAMPMDGPHGDLMAGMDAMNAEMMAGATAADLDVAFVCSMIPHHRGAIAMAKAELAHGDDPWARELAEKIIAAQEAEIADMLAWLEKQPTP
jgi:uncharacterized protein (DUF305 family)